MKVKESDLVVGDKYYLPNTETEAFFVGCINRDDGYDGFWNFFYTDKNVKEEWFVEEDGTIGFSMDSDDLYTYEEV